MATHAFSDVAFATLAVCYGTLLSGKSRNTYDEPQLERSVVVVTHTSAADHCCLVQ